MNHNIIPKTLDNPVRALGVPVDMLIVFVSVWSIFVLFDNGLIGIPVGIVFANLFGKYRQRSVIRKIIRFIYWYLPHEFNCIKGVEGHNRCLNFK